MKLGTEARVIGSMGLWIPSTKGWYFVFCVHLSRRRYRNAPLVLSVHSTMPV